MPVFRLVTKTVRKPWGRRSLGPGCDDVSAGEQPIGEIWFEVPRGSGLGEPELLIKHLFTSERLSVQVHPDDAAAKAHGLPRGKSEAWQILEAEPGASIAMGLREPITKDRLRAAAKDGSIVALLDWKPVRAGDFWYAPAGTIHAIGAGLSLIEIQQNVDVTYRLYDYGSNRELHLDEAVEAARPAPYEAPFAPFELARGRRVLAAGGPFVVERWADAFAGILAPRRGEPVWLIPLRGEAVVGSEPIEPGGVWIVAGDAGVNFTGSCDLLVAYSGRAVHEALISRSRNERQS
ncbi:phosphoheptose isomerase (plasmid) [Sphingomonas sanxanigenens DSM 19645 = NX02]|uniref:Phosphoheptose isomerase n=1 Tax=Sphingomonas sanxanigenens DSM 19645 = NX02 TaxID=1123269 RepID=A0A0F7JVJ8_9SPHN|nr:phosphoheptose isomerase [Sphingomonas sanxanigenens DSM 19645 = NX02]